MIYALFMILLLLTIFSIAIILHGSTVWNQLLGLNLVSTKIIILMILFSIIYDLSYVLDIAIAYTLLGFIGIILIARFVRRKDKM